ncbi:AAA family ATPase, partial [Limosilactobacillus reuteri]
MSKLKSLEMLTTKDMQDIITDLSKKFSNNKKEFIPYINSIRFPQYKLLVKGTKIDFEYPVTMLVGENGCNKTSILQALYGSPAGKSLETFWFETSVDKISKRNVIIYSYYQPKAKKNVEVLKTRIHSSSNPDYWEPSRPVKKYKMDPINKEELEKAGNKATTRWDPIEMNVVYCDCKEYVSAYDLFFYHYNFHKSKTINHRQDYIRKQSILLNKIISKDLNTYDYYG